jgi:hypothetical protein
MKSRLLGIFLLLFALLGEAAPVTLVPSQRMLLLYAYGYGGRGVELLMKDFSTLKLR